MVKILRDYQKSALNGLFSYLMTQKGNPIVVSPVGSGKSLMMAEFIQWLCSEYPGSYIMQLAHIKELLEQNAEELEEHWPNAPYGFYCASLRKKDLHNDITFASIQSIANKAGALPKVPDVIIVDECHTIPHKAQTRYRSFIADCKQRKPHLKVIGFTGTPFRADSGLLHEGDNALFDDIAYEVSMEYMLDEGYWKKPFCPTVKQHISTEGLTMRGGDFIDSELQEAANTDEITNACIKDAIAYAGNRKKWLIYTSGVEHCIAVAQALEEAGIDTRYVTANCDDRNETVKWFKQPSGDKPKALVNIAILTTGFNCPDIDTLVFMRPTRSPVLYVQCVGRGVRPVYADGYDLSTKQGRLSAMAASHAPDCMVLDFGGIVEALGPVDSVTIDKIFKEKKDGEKGEAPTKQCPNCEAICYAGQRFCYQCSHEFQFETNIEDKASSAAIVSGGEETYTVTGVTMHLHPNKTDPDNKPPTLRIDYHTYARKFSEWICFNHPRHTFPHDKAIAWHNERLPDMAAPDSVQEALSIPYPEPEKIIVMPDPKNPKYYRVKKALFSEVQVEEFAF